MLNLWRRHVADCKLGQKKGGKHTGCNCPIRCDGEVDGVRIRRSMDTCDWSKATRNLGKIEDPFDRLRPFVQPG